MKKLLLSFATLAIFFSVVAATCKEDPVDPTPTLTEYTCKCTYIPATGSPSEGQPNKEETLTIKSESIGSAKVECAQAQGKYTVQYFTGTCNIQ